MKKLLLVAFAAMMVTFFASCGKDKALVDTSWEYVESVTQGAESMTMTMTLNFTSETEGNLSFVTVFSMGGVDETQSDKIDFTYTFDGKKGQMVNDNDPIDFELTDKKHISVQMGEEGAIVFTKK